MPKQPTPRGPGQPRKYEPGQVVTVLLRLPADLAERLDGWRRGRGCKRTAAIQEAIRRMVRRA